MLKAEEPTLECTLPTNKYFFDWLMKDSMFSPLKPFNWLIRISTVSRFELLNLLIKESFTSCTLEELDEKTIELLRASVQLHPILTGERKDLGHPDEAVGPYALLEGIILEPTNTKNKAIKSLREQLNTSFIFKDVERWDLKKTKFASLKDLFNRIQSKFELPQKTDQIPKWLKNINSLNEKVDLSLNLLRNSWRDKNKGLNLG